MKYKLFSLFLRGFAACLLLSSCAGLRQQIRDDQLERLKFEEAEMTRTRQSIQEILGNPQHASLFIGVASLNRALSQLDGAQFLLDGPDASHPKKKETWLHVHRLRMEARNGLPVARLEGTVVRDWARVSVVGDAIIAPELDPNVIGEAHLRVRLRSLRPTIRLGFLAIPVWGLFRDVVELGLSQNLPKLDPKLNELPIQLTKVQGHKEIAKSTEYTKSQNFLNVKYRVDTPAIEFKVTQLIQAFFLDDGLYMYVHYQP